jgi:hypothetical protein
MAAMKPVSNPLTSPMSNSFRQILFRSKAWMSSIARLRIATARVWAPALPPMLAIIGMNSTRAREMRRSVHSAGLPHLVSLVGLVFLGVRHRGGKRNQPIMARVSSPHLNHNLNPNLNLSARKIAALRAFGRPAASGIAGRAGLFWGCVSRITIKRLILRCRHGITRIFSPTS